MPAETLVEVSGLVFAYRGRPALRGVDLALRRGEILALLGPNGAGKTSLMRLVAGRLAPEQGSVRVGGGDPHRHGATRRLIGWVPQQIALYGRLTVRENLDVFAQQAGLARRQRRNAVAETLETTAIAHVSRSIVGTLSGGYQRRVNIAASLVGRPRLVLLDEPTQGVDLEARAAIHALLAALRDGGAAILLATHDFGEAERLADRIAILRDGRILSEGGLGALMRPLSTATPEQELLLDEPADTAAEAVLRRRGFAPHSGTRAWRGACGNADALEGRALLAALQAEGVRVSELRLRRPGLETLYRDTLGAGRTAVALIAPVLAQTA